MEDRKCCCKYAGQSKASALGLSLAPSPGRRYIEVFKPAKLTIQADLGWVSIDFVMFRAVTVTRVSRVADSALTLFVTLDWNMHSGRSVVS